MKVLDLFSGIGGFSLGLERAGMTTAAFCEIEESCQMVLKENWPEVPIFPDVSLLFYEREGGDMTGKLKKLTQDQVEQSIILYEKGFSLADIGKMWGVSRQSMHDLLKRRVNLREQKRFGKDNHFYRGGAIADPVVHDITEKAIKNGILMPQPCEVCGANGEFKDGRNEVQAHHDDYNKPLEVRWLCQKHHHDWHKKNKAIKRKEVKGSVSNIDIIAGGFPC